MKRAARAGVILGLLWLLAGVPTQAPAQTQEAAFAGFALEAWGSGFSMIYDDPNGPIPAHPQGEMHAAYALATLSDGPSGHGVAAEVWPGATAATAGPFILDSVWDGMKSGSGGQFPPSQIPQPSVPAGWPLAAEVFEPSDTHTSDVPPNAHAHSTETVVYAKGATVPLSLPGVFSADAGSATSHTFVGKVKNAAGVEVDAVRSEVVTTSGSISVLGGKVKIDEVTTTAAVTSDGTKPAIEGRTLVSGLTIDGQGYEIDENGIKAGGQTNPNPITGQLNQAAESILKDSGISIMVAKPIDTTKGSTGSRSVGGLIVRMKATRLNDVVSQLPDQIEKEVRANLSTTHDLTLVFGAANVKASALKALSFEFDEEFDFALSGDEEFDAEVLGADLSAGDFGGGGDFRAPSGGGGAYSVPSGGAVITAQPAFAGPIEVEGVSALAVIVGLGAVVGMARGLKMFSDRALKVGGGRTASSCSDQ
ncbi:MAG: hypothetical protein HYU28_00850 [Actinobacteria bacterium]|nr:hypothetical protein [Actinomycetota bacterium]